MHYYRIDSPSVIHEIIDGEAVIVNLESGSYYSIDGTGVDIWEYVDRGLGDDQIVNAMIASYEGDRITIEKHVQQLLNQLREQKLIVPVDAPSTMEQAAAAAVGQEKAEFVEPVLHKYTDMEDLLLLDPIHEVDDTGWPNTTPNDAVDIEQTVAD